MSRETLVRRFAAVGARVSVPQGPWRGDPRIDVGADRAGEFFDIRFRGRERATELEVIDVRPHERHLLLLARVGGEKSKFLCGHDERHWFVAAIPEAARGVTGVASAKAALVPDLVWERVARTRPKDQLRRRNRAYVRQGEWFFVPAPDVNPSETLALRDEPLTRGGTPHVMQFAFRRGGELVYVQNRSLVLTQEEYDAIPNEGAQEALLGAARAGRRGVRTGQRPASGPRDDPPAVVAPRADEHGTGGARDAARRLPRLTSGRRTRRPRVPGSSNRKDATL